MSPETGREQQKYPKRRKQLFAKSTLIGLFTVMPLAGAVGGWAFGTVSENDRNSEKQEQAEANQRCMELVKSLPSVVQLSELTPKQRDDCGLGSLTEEAIDDQFGADTDITMPLDSKVQDISVQLPSVEALHTDIIEAQNDVETFNIGDPLQFAALGGALGFAGAIGMASALIKHDDNSRKRVVAEQQPVIFEPSNG